MEREPINGMMVGSTLAIGRIIKCMVKAFSIGLMVGYTMVNIKMIKNMDLESFNGQMVEAIKVSGRMGSSMGKEFILIAKEKEKKEYGLKVN